MTLFTRDSFGRMGVTTPTQLPERGPRVKIHRNAKTTPRMRALIVHRVQAEHWRVTEAAAAAGVTRRTAAKWLARYRAGGAPALEDRSSRPAHSPRRTSTDQVAAITALRHDRLTAWAIAVRLQIPRSTVARVLARVGLNQLARLTPPAPVHRYEYSATGALVHLDVKPLVRILRAAIACTATDARWCTAPAGNMCMSPLMTTAVWPMSKSCLISGGRRPLASSA